MNERVKELRKLLKISQDAFSSKINISRPHYALIEGGSKNLTDRVISDICREFNVNEEWLRSGTGEMFLEPDTFSLDEYVKQKNASDFDLDFIKGYLNFPKELRKSIEEHFKTEILPELRAKSELAATEELTTGCEPVPHIKEAKEVYIDDSIKAEVEAFTAELMATKKGQTSLVSEKQDGKLA